MTYHRSYASHTRVLIALLISVCAGCGDSSPPEQQGAAGTNEHPKKTSHAEPGAEQSPATVSAQAPDATQGDDKQVASRSLTLFGQVVDQDKRPVAGAKIVLRYSTQSGPYSQEFRTDADGRFKLLNAPRGGYDLGSISREGYTLPPSDDRHVSLYPGYPDKPGASHENPWVLRMWRVDTSPKPLVECRWDQKDMFIEPARDGTPLSFNVVTKEKSEHVAAFAVTMKMSGKRYDPQMSWIVTLESTDAQIAEAVDDPYRYLAPENGYQAKLSWRFTNQQSESSKYVFIKTAAGQYGKMAVFLKLDGFESREMGLVAVSNAVLNPNGSRNLLPADSDK